MSKNYAKRRTRSRRKSVKDLGGQVRELDTEGATVQLSLPIKEILAGVHGAVREVCGTAGLLIMQALIDEEVEQQAGTKYKHDSDQGAVRWGQEDSYLHLGGKKVAAKRPRLRDRDGREVLLCWRHGEEEIGFWHEVDAGFQGRQSLLESSLFGEDSTDDEST